MNFHKGTLFPEKLHCMLEYAEDQGLHDILSWNSSGLAFTVHDPDLLTKMILPIFLGATKYKSFARQLNIWSFHRYTGDSGACNNNKNNNDSSNSTSTLFEHPYFIRGKKSLCENLTRESFKRSIDCTDAAQTSCSRSRRHQMNLHNNNTRKSKAAAAASHVQTQNKGGISNKDTSESSSSSSSSTNGQLSAPPVATLIDAEPPDFTILTPCKRSDSNVASLSSSSDAWAPSEAASFLAREDDDMTIFLDGDLIDFEGKQFFFLDVKR
jgi:hypothetical protein